MAYKIKSKPVKEKTAYSVEAPKKDPKKLFLEELKNKDTLSEQDVLLIKRRLNDGTYTTQEVYEMLGDDGKALTSEQQEKGKAWLMDKWKSPTGAERKNNPYGIREQEVLDKFSELRLKDFYDTGNANFHHYEPYYEVVGNDTSFEYYNKAGEPAILG